MNNQFSVCVVTATWEDHGCICHDTRIFDSKADLDLEAIASTIWAENGIKADNGTFDIDYQNVSIPETLVDSICRTQYVAVYRTTHVRDAQTNYGNDAEADDFQSPKWVDTNAEVFIGTFQAKPGDSEADVRKRAAMKECCNIDAIRVIPFRSND